MTEQRFRLVGDADMLAAPGIAEDLHKVIDACGDDLLIDCIGCEFIDSSGIAVLVAARKALDTQGRRMRIVNVPRTGRLAIDACGLRRFFGLEATDETLVAD